MGFQSEKSLMSLQRSVAKVLRTLTVASDNPDAPPQYSNDPDELIHVYFKAPDWSIHKDFPADWLLQPFQDLPEGHYRVVLLDKPELQGGNIIGEHECQHTMRLAGERHGTDEQRAVAMALENMRASCQDLRETIARQRDEILALRDELDRKNRLLADATTPRERLGFRELMELVRVFQGGEEQTHTPRVTVQSSTSSEPPRAELPPEAPPCPTG